MAKAPMSMDPVEIAALFDARAPRYVDDEWHRRYAEQFVAVIPIREGDRALDAGTGTGFAACAIARRVGPAGCVVAVDVSPGMLQQARTVIAEAGLANIELLQADATELREIAPRTFDVVACSAGLLYMPASKALHEWHRLLKPDGVVAFSTMRAGSPSAGRTFRHCAREFGVTLDDASEPLGTEERCRAALEDAGFQPLDVIAGHVDFAVCDPEAAWNANFCAAGHATHQLGLDVQRALHDRYVAALRQAIETDPRESRRADVLFAVGRRVPALSL